MLDPRNISREWYGLLDKAEVPEIRFHDLRRTAATHWAKKGFTPKQIMNLLGHADSKVALEIYTDVLKEQSRDAFLDESDMFPD